MEPGSSHMYPVTGSGANQWYVAIGPTSKSTKVSLKLSKRLGDGEIIPDAKQVRLLTWEDIYYLDPTYRGHEM